MVVPLVLEPVFWAALDQDTGHCSQHCWGEYCKNRWDVWTWISIPNFATWSPNAWHKPKGWDFMEHCIQIASNFNRNENRWLPWIGALSSRFFSEKQPLHSEGSGFMSCPTQVASGAVAAANWKSWVPSRPRWAGTLRPYEIRCLCATARAVEVLWTDVT